ncbi:MAG TPA: protein phosphatase 2C domain-containing protein [Symbiobacteriaceae bacterium]|jgi:protein phosphatase
MGNEERPQPKPLEELVLPSVPRGQTPGPGSVLEWAGEQYVVEAALPGGWYRAHDAAGRPVQLRPEGELNPVALRPHPLLPVPLYTGPEGCVLPWVEGSPLQEGALPLPEALAHLTALARFMALLEATGYALVDLDPDALVLSEGGLMLRVPPRVCHIGKTLPALYREGYTPGEVSLGGVATGREGVYVLGGVLYRLLTGAHPPLDPTLAPAGISLPGVPQLLASALAADAVRLTPQQFINALLALGAPPDPVLAVGAATIIGLNPDRLLNEDAYGYQSRVVEAHERRVRLLTACVADGMGGMDEGEDASRAAVDAFLAGYPPEHCHGEAQADWTLEQAWSAAWAVGDAVNDKGGCTFTGVAFVGARCTLAHVGDSRAYLFSRGLLTQLSRDHSLVAAMVASGVITAQEARTSPDRNKLLRSLGMLRRVDERYIEDLAPTTGARTLDLGPGDAVLLVSDGVWGELSDEQLLECVREAPEQPQRVVARLLDAVVAAGAPDNVTAVMIARVQ